MTTYFSRALPFLMSFWGSNALAQSDFAGLYGQISTGYESNYLNSLNGTNINTPNDNNNTIITSPNQSWGLAPLVLGIGYYLQAHEKLLFGLGADYSALSKISSNWDIAITNAPGNFSIKPGDTVLGFGSNMKLSNRFNVFFSPAYVIDKEKLLYLKFGYSQVSTQLNHATTVSSTNLSGQSITAPATTAGYHTSNNQPGYILGLGYRQIIVGGFYGFGEGEYMGYKAPSFNFTIVKPVESVMTNSTQSSCGSYSGLNAYQLLVGLGYAF